MALEKRGFCIVIVFLFIFIFGGISVSAYVYDCKFMNISDCTGSWSNIVMRVSGETNAHGELYNYTNYQYGICCNFTNSSTRNCASLTGSNILVNLSSPTNAHAALKSNLVTPYRPPICYDQYFKCENLGACDPPYYLEVLSVSGPTNAHLGSPDAYPNYKICCNYTLEPAESLTCAQKGGNTCNSPITVCPAGNIITASDTTQCCEVECCVASINEACNDPNLDRDCGTFKDSCGVEHNCGECEAPKPECTEVGICVDPTTCELAAAIWDRDYAWAGQNVSLLVYGSNVCSGNITSFEIFQERFLFIPDDPITELGGVNPDPVTFNSNGIANASWIAEYHSASRGLPNYYFKAFVQGLAEEKSREPNLEVNTSACLGITKCSDYTPLGENACESNNCSGITIPQGEIDDNVTCGIEECNNGEDNWYSCSCAWRNNECVFAPNEIGCIEDPTCDDGLRETGETCDGEDLNDMDCTDFEFSGGNLLCDSSCEYDFSSCTGYDTSNCGNGVVDFGKEVCDRTNDNVTKRSGGNWECSDFDEFSDGILGCRPDCTFDTSGCTSALNGFNYGTCIKSQTGATDCDEGGGFYTSYWDGTYIWGHDGWSTEADCETEMDQTTGCYYDLTLHKWFYDPSGMRKSSCVGSSETTIECPAEIKLPFFGFYNLVLSLLMIGLIYTVLYLHKKKR